MVIPLVPPLRLITMQLFIWRSSSGSYPKKAGSVSPSFWALMSGGSSGTVLGHSTRKMFEMSVVIIVLSCDTSVLNCKAYKSYRIWMLCCCDLVRAGMVPLAKEKWSCQFLYIYTCTCNNKINVKQIFFNFHHFIYTWHIAHRNKENQQWSI